MANLHSNISFALVNIPIVMNPIIRDNDIPFNQLHKKCLNRIKYIKYCPHCKKDIKENDIIKAYQYDKDNYITFTKDELNDLKLTNEKEIEVIGFLNLSEIDPYYFEKSFYLMSDNSNKSYKLFLEALKKVKKVALCKTVIGSKFYYCILRSNNNGLLLTTLYFYEEVNIPEYSVYKDITKKELDLAIKLIDSMNIKFNPKDYIDEYQTNIRDAIDDKLDGKKIKKKNKNNKEQIKDLMKALEKSLKNVK